MKSLEDLGLEALGSKGRSALVYVMARAKVFVHLDAVIVEFVRPQVPHLGQELKDVLQPFVVRVRCYEALLAGP